MRTDGWKFDLEAAHLEAIVAKTDGALPIRYAVCILFGRVE